jgi:hypothetical protein
VDQPLTERRIDVRFSLPHASITRATLRPGCAVHVVDLSARGALVQAGQPLRPGARVHFQLVTTERTFALVGRILRCAVWTLDAERGATYRGALHFDERCEFSGEYETLDEAEIPFISGPDVRAGRPAIPTVRERWRSGRWRRGK